MIELVAGAETLPTGSHSCELATVEEVKGRFDDLALRWTFECSEGEQAGRQARKTTGTLLAADNALGELIGWLLDQSVRRGLRVRIDDLIGRRFMVTVAGGQVIKVKPVVVKPVEVEA